MAKTTIEIAEIENKIVNMVELKQIGLVQLLKHTKCECDNCQDVRTLTTFRNEKLT